MQDHVSRFPNIGFLIHECELKHLTEGALIEYEDPGQVSCQPGLTSLVPGWWSVDNVDVCVI